MRVVSWVTQERTIDADAAKVDENAKADAPDASNASETSNIDTPKIVCVLIEATKVAYTTN